jgi:hypothetical protein
MKLIAPFGILESSRTGLMALPRTPLEDAEEEVGWILDMYIVCAHLCCLYLLDRNANSRL